MNFKKNKKGSHVGIILSFTLFITFLIFAYVIIGPPASLKENKKESMPILKENILDKISEDITTIRIYDILNDSGCIQTSLPENNFTNPTIFVVDSNENEVSSKILSNNILLGGGRNLTKIYFSNNAFSDNEELSLSSCSSVIPDSLTNEERITEKSILNLINDIQNNYDTTKNDLGVSIGDEINILFDYLNGTLIGGDNYDSKSNIYAQTIKADYLNLNAEEKIGGIIIKIW